MPCWGIPSRIPNPRFPFHGILQSWALSLHGSQPCFPPGLGVFPNWNCASYGTGDALGSTALDKSWEFSVSRDFRLLENSNFGNIFIPRSFRLHPSRGAAIPGIFGISYPFFPCPTTDGAAKGWIPWKMGIFSRFPKQDTGAKSSSG